MQIAASHLGTWGFIKIESSRIWQVIRWQGRDWKNGYRQTLHCTLFYIYFYACFYKTIRTIANLNLKGSQQKAQIKLLILSARSNHNHTIWRNFWSSFIWQPKEGAPAAVSKFICSFRADWLQEEWERLSCELRGGGCGLAKGRTYEHKHVLN